MKKFLKNYYYIILPICLTVLLILICPLRTMRVDDLGMLKITSESYAGSENLVISSVLYGYLFRAISSVMPSYRWLIGLYFLVLNISMVVLHKIAKDNGSPIYAVGLLVILQTAILVRITFTALAFLSCTTAVMWVMHKVKELSVKSIVYFAEAFLLFFIGFAMRTGDIFVCIFMLFMPFYFFAVLEKRNKLSVVIIMLILCTVANYSVKTVKTIYNSTIPDETFFNQLNEYRVTIQDRGHFNYRANAELYKSQGISENDVNMAEGKIYADRNVFNRDTLKVLAESKDIDDLYMFHWQPIARGMADKVYIWFFLILARIAFAVLKKNRREIIAISVFVMGALGYLFVRQRGVEHVINQIAITGIIMLMCVAMRSLKEEFSFSNIKAHKWLAVCLAGLFCLNIIAPWAHSRTDRAKNNMLAPLYDYIDKHEDNVFLYDMYSREDFAKYEYKLTDPVEQGPIYDLFGGWRTYSPYWYHTVERLGLDQYSDKIMNAVLDSKVRYVDDKEDVPKQLITFFKEHYDIDAHYEVEQEFDTTDYKIYRFIED